MNRKQIQTNLFKAMLDGKNTVLMEEINENDVAFTYDGYELFVMDKSQMIVDLSKIKQTSGFKEYFVKDENDVSVFFNGNLKSSLTNFKPETVELESSSKKEDDKAFKVYAQAKLYRNFSDCTLKANSPTSRILAYDDFDNLIGLFLPLKY
jgi:hypothetical protein